MVDIEPERTAVDRGFFQRIDPRTGLVLLIGVALMAMHLHFRGLSGVTLLLLAVFPPAGVKPRGKARASVYWLIFLLFVWLSRALTTPGETLFKSGPLTLSREGAIDGLLVGWRLTVVLLAGVLYTATARTSQTKAALQWFLKPVPWLPERRMAVMLSLLIRFIPVVLRQVGQTLMAQRARAVECRKNPFYRTVKLAVPAIRRVFLTADRLTLAMEARCFSENRTDPMLVFGRWDGILLALLGIAYLLALLF
jgi:energy-coupling factor transporter transmembrane protein EcfT